MRRPLASPLCMAVAALCCGGCASLPSVDSVRSDFRRQHPTAEILHVSSRVDVSDEATIHVGNATFEVLYRERGSSRSFIYERKYGTVAEGWIEGPSRTSEVVP
jgi:hypothetical protein